LLRAVWSRRVRIHTHRPTCDNSRDDPPYNTPSHGDTDGGPTRHDHTVTANAGADIDSSLSTDSNTRTNGDDNPPPCNTRTDSDDHTDTDTDVHKYIPSGDVDAYSRL
jgi:hypothetical protein